MRYDYLKEFLKENIANRTNHNLQHNYLQKRDWQNKGYKLRCQSVAKQIQTKERELSNHMHKILNKTFRD